MRSSAGSCYFTGVGKSGIIAKKIAATMIACGLKAFYFSAQDALHGDIGIVEEGSLVFLLSKSGETSEVLELCPALKNRRSVLCAVTMNGSSRLAKMCDTMFLLPQLKELCPYDLAPTTSTLAQLVFGDLLAMALMRLKKVSLHDFIRNHPSGRIGKRQILRVRDLMLQGKDLPCARKKTFFPICLWSFRTSGLDAFAYLMQTRCFWVSLQMGICAVPFKPLEPLLSKNLFLFS